jgi:beta-lactamase regulating signal transducer with metallopeptidase domain
MTSSLALALSEALLHFIWQGAAVGFLLWVALLLLRKAPAQARYLAGCTALAAMAVLPGVTTWILYPHHSATAAAAAFAAVASAPAGHAAAVGDSWLTLVQTWALPIWSVGVLILSLRLVWSAKQVYTLRRRGVRPDQAVLAAVTAVAARLGLRRPVQVLISALADGPSVVGWIRPVLLLPPATLLGLTAQQLEAVLAHELAHIRRYDYLVNVLQMMVETLLFYHPAVWWTSARIRRERELCCDDLAVRSCGDALCYARALTTLERMRISTPGMALGSTGGPLRYRILRLVGAGSEEHGSSRLAGILALAVGLLCFSLNTHWAQGQSSPVPQPKAQTAVTVEATVDAAGNVQDARVINGPLELRKAALESVLKMHFASQPAGSTRQITLSFTAPNAAPKEVEQRIVTDTGNNRVLIRNHVPAVPTADQRAVELQLYFEELKARFKAVLDEQAARMAKEQVELTELAARKAAESPAPAAQEAIEQTKQTLDLQVAIQRLKAMLALAQKQDQPSMPEVQRLEEKLQFAEEELAKARQEGLAKAQHEANWLAGRTVAEIGVSGIPDEARNDLLAKLPIRTGDTLSAEDAKRIRAVVKEFDEHLGVSYQLGVNGQVSIRIYPWPHN